MTVGSKLLKASGGVVRAREATTKDARFLGCSVPQGEGRSPTAGLLFVPGDRKNSDLRVSLHFYFSFCFSLVATSFECAGEIKHSLISCTCS